MWLYKKIFNVTKLRLHGELGDNMKAKGLAKKINELSKCEKCGDDMLISLITSPLDRVIAKVYDFEGKGLVLNCDSCGYYAFISAKEIER